MDINKRDLLLAGLTVGAGVAASNAVAQPAAPAAGTRARGGIDQDAASSNSGIQPSTVDLNYKPRRINKMIELWEDGQKVYYTHDGVTPDMGPNDAYEHGKKMAKTYCDAIEYNIEHGPLDFTAFANFMQGLAAGGPTKSGHATPAVFVIPPCTGLSEQFAYNNAWIIWNFLDLGAHGIMIAHSRDPLAIEVYVQEAGRYPLEYPNTPKLARRGLRTMAAAAPAIWGISNNKYMHVSDPWPLNPRGELVFGVKIEDLEGDPHAPEILAVKGLSFGEIASVDQTLSLIGLAAYPEEAADGGVFAGGRGGRGGPGAGPAGAAAGAAAGGRGGRGAGGPGGGPGGGNPEQASVLQAMRDKMIPEFKKNNIHMFGDTFLGANNEEAVRKAREASGRKMPV